MVQPGPGPYRIQAAADLCGIPAPTLRAWERRYGIPAPSRTSSAYRLYTREDVALLRRMRELVEEKGVAPAEAARVLLLRQATPKESANPRESPLSGLELAQQKIIAATLAWDAAAIDAELTRLSMLVDAQTMFEHVFSPVLAEIGARWERGELSVAQEHLVSERMEIALRAGLRAMERTDGPLVLIACIDLEQHVLGALGAALRFAASGARVVLLGAMVPPFAIAEAVRNMAPRMVGLSVSLSPTGAKRLFRAYGDACKQTPWIVGGAAAESLRNPIEAAGGRIAKGSAREWSLQVRGWLRATR